MTRSARRRGSASSTMPCHPSAYTRGRGRCLVQRDRGCLNLARTRLVLRRRECRRRRVSGRSLGYRPPQRSPEGLQNLHKARSVRSLPGRYLYNRVCVYASSNHRLRSRSVRGNDSQTQKTCFFRLRLNPFTIKFTKRSGLKNRISWSSLKSPSENHTFCSSGVSQRIRRESKTEREIRKNAY